jgi:hypothetical protein
LGKAAQRLAKPFVQLLFAKYHLIGHIEEGDREESGTKWGYKVYTHEKL